MSVRTYRHLLQIEQPGEQSSDWTKETEPVERVGEIYAAIIPMRGQELENAMQIDSRISHKITSHWTDKIDTTKRLRKGDRIFQIMSAINVGEQNRWLELMCIETTT